MRRREWRFKKDQNQCQCFRIKTTTQMYRLEDFFPPQFTTHGVFVSLGEVCKTTIE